MIDNIIYKLNKKGICFSLNGDKLKVSADVKPSEEDMLIIKENKKFIIDYVRQRSVVMKAIPKIEDEEYYPLSSAQRRLWILSRFDGAHTAYNIHQVVRLEGNLSEVAFIKAYKNLLTRHEVLRTAFTEDAEGNPRQLLLQITDEKFNIRIEDYIHYSQEEKDSKIKNYVSEEISRGFSLEEGPLMRCSLLRETENSYVWVLVIHHIVSDGWSMGILSSEWSELYNAEIEKRTHNLEPLRIQYKDYAAWQIKQLESENIKIHKEYWLKQFKGEIQVLTLQSDKNRPKEMTYHGAYIHRELDKVTTERLKTFSQNQGGSMFITLQLAINILLHKYTGQEDIVVGSPNAGRDHPDLEEQIGFYVNTLALRNQFSKEDKIADLYQKIKQNTFDAYKHQSYPYDELVDSLIIERDRSRNPLFDVWFDYHSIDIENNRFQFNGLNEKEYLKYTKEYNAKFDIAIIISENTKGGLNVHLEYKTDIYTNIFIERMILTFEHVLEVICTNTEKKISCLNILTEQDKIYLLDALNPLVNSAYPKDKTVVDLFEEQVEKSPDAFAIKYREINLTYKELNEKSNQLAHYLIKNHKIQPDDLVGIELERNELMVIVILAIVKAGGAYVPIDSMYPKSRKEKIEKMADLVVIINNEFLDEYSLTRSLYQQTNPETNINPHNLIYCMFTSGSTGEPKGVLIEHKNVFRLVYQPKYIQLNSKDSLLQTGAIEFDASTFEIWGTLVNGAQLHLLPKEYILDIVKFREYILLNKITTMWLTSAFFDSLVNLDAGLFFTLKKLLVGGSTLNPSNIDIVRSSFPDLKIINAYGPTENTTFSTTYFIQESQSNIPIGRPINNSSVYIMNEDLQLKLIGSIGEIFLGGIGVARGYLGQDELNSQKFIENPYRSGEKLYRTGDLGRWRDDGNLEYWGRIDNQVKIRGYRIEPGEIEQLLIKYQYTGQVVVIAKAFQGAREKELIIYFTGKAEINNLKDYLNEHLPQYMVPKYYVNLESIPLTPNGKLDIKALPFPNMEFNDNKYLFYGTWLDSEIQKIWSEIIGVDLKSIPLNEDFFRLGGNSLKLISLTHALNKKFNKNLRFRDLILNSSVMKMRELINKTNTDNEKTFYRLNSQMNGVPKLLMIPPSNGEGLVYKNLAMKLDSIIEIWTLDFDKLINNTIDTPQYANLLFEIWLKEQGSDSILIGGYSIGFRIAYFMGLNLKNQVLYLLSFDGIIYKNEEEKNILEKKDESNTLTFEDEIVFQNDWFDEKIVNPIIHFLCQKTISEGLYSNFCSDINELIILEGDHNSIMDYGKNILIISDFIKGLVKELNICS